MYNVRCVVDIIDKYLQWDDNEPKPCDGCDCAVAVLNDSRLQRLQARSCTEEHRVICPGYEGSSI